MHKEVNRKYPKVIDILKVRIINALLFLNEINFDIPTKVLKFLPALEQISKVYFFQVSIFYQY